MKLKLLFFVLTLSTVTAINAQKKSELLTEISTLRFQLDSINALITNAQKKQKVAEAEAESFKGQVTELQHANQTLMKSLTSFTEVSTKNSTNFNKAMERLNEKEKQLAGINNAISRNDSTALVVLTKAKQTLGENAKISVANGSVIISSSLASIFETDTGTSLSAAGKTWIEKISQILAMCPNMAISIEGLSMTGNLEVPFKQASAIGMTLLKMNIAPERISSIGKDGNLKEGIVLKIHPMFNEFYKMAKEQMKHNK